MLIFLSILFFNFNYLFNINCTSVISSRERRFYTVQRKDKRTISTDIVVISIYSFISLPNIQEFNYISRVYYIKYYYKINIILIYLYRINKFLLTACNKNPILYLKIRIIPKSYTINISQVVIRSRGTREITIDKSAVFVSVINILDRNIELFLALKAPVKKLKAIYDPISYRD